MDKEPKGGSQEYIRQLEERVKELEQKVGSKAVEEATADGRATGGAAPHREGRM